MISYQKRGVKIPEAPEGIVYKNMGDIGEPELYCGDIADEAPEEALVGEWGEQYGESLYQKENREFIDTIERYIDGLIFPMQMKEIIYALSTTKAPKKDGKGNPYADKISHHMPMLDAMQAASSKAFRATFCYERQPLNCQKIRKMVKH